MRQLRPAELTAVRRKARAAFALNHGGAGGDLLSPEFSPVRPAPRPKPTRPGAGRVIPLRPDFAGWTRPLVGGEPLHPAPGLGRHHRPEHPLRLTLTGYTGHTTTENTPPARRTRPGPRPRIRRYASRVRAYVSHPARDLAPLTLAVRAYLSREVR